MVFLLDIFFPSPSMLSNMLPSADWRRLCSRQYAQLPGFTTAAEPEKRHNIVIYTKCDKPHGGLRSTKK